MLGFFRINDPYRLLILFIAVLLIRLAYIIGADPLVYEWDWMTVGENLNQGKILYKDFVSSLSPLSAWTYMITDFIFGKRPYFLQILSVFLITYQFSLFNNIMLRNKAFNESSYIPALIYALLTHIFYDFFTLSPVLISLTFILLVLDNIYLRIENKLDDATILKTGFFMGLAVLFYLPSIIFFVATILSFALLTSLIVRRYLLFVYGFILPIAVVILYFFWQDSLYDFYYQWIYYSLFSFTKHYVDTVSILVIIAIPLLTFLFSLYKTFAASRFTNYQVRVQQVMFIMFLAGLGTWWLSGEKAPYQLLVFLPSLAFFIVHFVLQFKKKRSAEIFTIIFSITIISICYSIFYQNFSFHKLGNFNALRLEQSIYVTQIKDKNVMILGGAKEDYYQSKNIATRFYHQKLSKDLLDRHSEKKQLIAINKDIKINQPEIIIDAGGRFNKLIDHLPMIKANYNKLSHHIFKRKVSQANKEAL